MQFLSPMPFHILQGFWYRRLSTRRRQILTFSKEHNVSIVEGIRERTGIDPIPPEMVASTRNGRKVEPVVQASDVHV
jgi:hypothetical protein